MPEPNTIGARLRTVRRYRGQSLQVLADRSGLSKSFLSMVENGRRSLDRRSHITALANALEVSVGELTGQPYSPPPSPNGNSGHGTVPGVRVALLGSSLDEPADAPVTDLPSLRDDTDEVERLCEKSKYGQFGRLLPDLLPGLHVAAVDGDDERDRKQALRALVRAMHATFYLLKDLGYLDLAQIAIQQGREAATRLEDPVFEGLAAFTRTHALVPAGVYPAALRSARRAAERLQPHVADQAAGELYGMLHLSAALVCVNMNAADDASAYLTEAAEVAERTGEGNAFGMHFGPTNVGVWRVALMVELGEPSRADEIARSVIPEQIGSNARRASFFADWGRALAQLRGRDREAVEKIRQAEKLAPEQIRNNPLVREAINHLLVRARIRVDGRDLRALAYRFGLS